MLYTKFKTDYLQLGANLFSVSGTSVIILSAAAFAKILLRNCVSVLSWNNIHLIYISVYLDNDQSYWHNQAVFNKH